MTFPNAACPSQGQSPAIVGGTCPLPTQLPSLAPAAGAAALADKLPKEALGLLSSLQQTGRGVGLGKQKMMNFQEGEGNRCNGWGAVDTVFLQ